MNYVDIILCMQKSLCLHIAHTLVTVHAIYWVQWKGIFNTDSELLQNYTEKQIIPFKTTVNWLFNDIWCYLVVGCFDWKIVIFQQIVVRVYYILNFSNATLRYAYSYFIWVDIVLNLYHMYLSLWKTYIGVENLLDMKLLAFYITSLSLLLFIMNS